MVSKSKPQLSGVLRISRLPHQGQTQTVKDHLLETGAIAARNLEHLSQINLLVISLAQTAGHWHDLGKFSNEWQSYLNQGIPKKSPGHAKQGAILAFQQKCYPVASAILGHHAGLHNWTNVDSLQEKLKNKSDWDGIKAIAEQEFSPEFFQAPDYSLKDSKNEISKDELLTRIIFSALIDADRESVARFMGTWQEPQTVSLETIRDRFENYVQKLTKNLESSPINQIRTDIYQTCRQSALNEPGFFRLSTPTGGGKTLSAMIFALDHAIHNQQNRIIYCPPYTSIIEQSADIYRQACGEDVVLEHHSGVIFENEEELKNYEIASQRWDYPIIVTTTVQFFESLFSRHPSQCRKVHRITNCVIVLDEIQVLPEKYLAPIMQILRELVEDWHCTVVFCSATQPWYGVLKPPTFEDIIPPQKRHQHFAILGQRVHYHYQPTPWTWEDLLRDIQQNQHPNALIVVSRKKAAKTGFEALSLLGNCYHLSTNLYAQHRRQIIQEIKQRLKEKLPTFLISTQLVEAGVDLDFDAGYRLITGLDSIIQTAGRINRNHRPSSSPLTIFDLENCERLPSDRQRILYTQKKLEDLQKQNKIQALDQEENCSGYFKTLFTAKHTQSSNQVNNFDEEDINSKRLNYEFKKVSEAFKLIEENNKIDVIITRDRRASELINKLKSDNFLNQKEWRELYQYSVSVTTAIAQAKGEIINQNVCLWKGDYDQSLGLISTN